MSEPLRVVVMIPTKEQERPESRGSRRHMGASFWRFVIENKWWWLVPALILLGLAILLLLLGGSGVSPFMYSRT